MLKNFIAKYKRPYMPYCISKCQKIKNYNIIYKIKKNDIKINYINF